MAEVPECEDRVCAITIWPGSNVRRLLDEPKTVGLVTTGPMRARLEGADRSLEYGRHLLARITSMPYWDAADASVRERALKAVKTSIHEVFGSRIDLHETVDGLRNGDVWLSVNIIERLLTELEIAVGGSEPPPVGERLSSAGISRLVILEPHHRDSDFHFWVDTTSPGAHSVILIVDPGLERADSALDGLPRHELQGALDISQTMRDVLSRSPARTDTPPPASGPIGSFSIHRFDDVDTDDFGWLAASALASTGIPTKTDLLADISLGVESSGKTILVITPRQAEESYLRYQLAQHLEEPVLLLRGGRDDRAVRLCSRLLQGISTDSPHVIADVILEGVAGIAPDSLNSAKKVLGNVPTAPIRDWISEAGSALRRGIELRPIGTTLQRLAPAIDAGPSQIIREVAALLPFEASGRATRSMQGKLSPTIQRAASSPTIDGALGILHAAGWSPSRMVEFQEGEPRIFVASANRIGSSVADIVVILRPGTRGFLANRSLSSQQREQIIYRCLASATESAHVIHRGPNDFMRWMT